MIIPYILNLFLNVVLLFKEQIEHKLLIFIINNLLLLFIIKKYQKILIKLEKKEKQLQHMNLDIGFHNLNEKYKNEHNEKKNKKNKVRSIVI
mgnify:CR=1 FL=1|jgi:hypothetical protein